MSAPTLHLDKSSPAFGIYLESDGNRVNMEDAFRDGFTISSEDAPAILTLVMEFIRAKGEPTT